MAVSLYESTRYQRLRRQFIIFLVACIAFSTVIYMPIYWLLYSNVVWTNSPLMVLWMELVEPLMNYAFYLGSFAFVIFGTARFGLRKMRLFAFLYAGAAFLRYLTNVFSYVWIMGAIHVSEWVTYDLPGMLFSTGMDWLQMGIVLLVCRSCLDGRKYEPVPRVFAGGIPMLRVAWTAALLPAATQLLSRIYYDLNLLLSFGDKVGMGGEVLLMLSYYVTDLLTIPVGFLILALILKLMSRAETRAKQAWDEEKSFK